MAKVLKDCHKCTNTYTGIQNGKPCSWCRAVVDGLTGHHIISGDCGKNFVFDCDHYSEDPARTVPHPVYGKEENHA